MRYWQVNQAFSNNVEFNRRYLCCPATDIRGGQTMLELVPGDVLFHYNATVGWIVAVSEVAPFTEPTAIDGAIRFDTQMMTPVTMKYRGRHLSESSMTASRVIASRKNDMFFEAKICRGVAINCGPNFLARSGKYLNEIDAEVARERLMKRRVAGFFVESAP